MRAPPHASTIRRLLSRLDTAAVKAALTRWVLARRPAAQQAAGAGPVAEGRAVLAVDGKTLRGARDGEGRQTKLVCVYDHAQRLVLTQTGVVDGGEIAAFKSNQPALRRALVALPWGQVPGARRRQLGHGRVESRSIKVVDLDGHPAQALFPHAARAIKVVGSAAGPRPAPARQRSSTRSPR